MRKRIVAVILSVMLLAGIAGPAEAHNRRRRRSAHHGAVHRHRLRHVSHSHRAVRPPPTGTSSTCGGDLPPCYVMQRESKGDPRVWNGGCYMPVGSRGRCPRGRSTASGKWQFVRGTWNNHGGYVNAADAPADVQDQKARQVWANGRGCRHWAACGRR